MFEHLAKLVQYFRLFLSAKMFRIQVIFWILTIIQN